MDFFETFTTFDDGKHVAELFKQESFGNLHWMMEDAAAYKEDYSEHDIAVGMIAYGFLHYLAQDNRHFLLRNQRFDPLCETAKGLFSFDAVRWLEFRYRLKTLTKFQHDFCEAIMGCDAETVEKVAVLSFRYIGERVRRNVFGQSDYWRWLEVYNYMKSTHKLSWIM